MIAAVAAAFLLIPAAAPSLAGGAHAFGAAQTIDLLAAKKKAKKPKAKNEEYLRAMPSK